MEKLVFIPNGNYFIPGVLSIPDSHNGKLSALLLVHGYLSCKNGDGFIMTKIAERLRNKNIASLRIDCCSCGESRRSRKDYNTETITREVELAYKYLQTLDCIDSNKIGLLGHSYGGRTVFKCSDLQPKCIVSLNGNMKYDYDKMYKSYSDKFLVDEDGDRYLMLKQSDTRIELLFEEFFKIELKHDKDPHPYNGNVLVCVAANDPSVDPNCSHDFYRELDNNNKSLIVIDGANHTFNAKTLDYTKLNELMDKIEPWLDINLK